jgi:hypothetical protein
MHLAAPPPRLVCKIPGARRFAAESDWNYLSGGPWRLSSLEQTAFQRMHSLCTTNRLTAICHRSCSESAFLSPRSLYQMNSSFAPSLFHHWARPGHLVPRPHNICHATPQTVCGRELASNDVFISVHITSSFISHLDRIVVPEIQALATSQSLTWQPKPLDYQAWCHGT